jgi:ribose 5-phosphate isomerase RpiB
MKVVLGGDSAGKPLVDVLMAHLKTKPELEVTDLSQSGYYADMAARVAQSILDGEYDRGILCCGTGIGVCISAERAAKSNNAQIITMGARVIGPELAKAIADMWLASEFDPNGPSAGNVEAINRLDAKKPAAV